MIWILNVEVFSPDLDLAEVWMDLPAHARDPDLIEVGGWGMRDEPEGLNAEAEFLVQAPDRDGSEVLAKPSTTARAGPRRGTPAQDRRMSGPCPLERVDIDEQPERVTITLWERYPPSVRPGRHAYRDRRCRHRELR